MKSRVFDNEKSREAKATSNTEESKITKYTRYLDNETLIFSFGKLAFSPQAYVDWPFSVFADFGDK
jgi:hypothetical protein